MKRSFYHYLMTERDPHKKDEVTQFANAASEDLSFPKQSTDFDEVSNYLEMETHYLPSMQIFDEAWQRYLESSQKEGL